MSSERLENLAGLGHIKPEAAKADEIANLVAGGRKRLADAKKKTNSIEGRFDLAYNASHAFALAALRRTGYRSANNRAIVFQALELTVGMPPAKWRVLDKAHQLRNRMEYDGNYNVEERIVLEVIAIAEELSGLL